MSWAELWHAFEIAAHQGKIGYVGSSNFAGWDIAVAQGEAKTRGIIGLVSEQHKYNLLCRLPELEVLPASQSLGLGVIPWSPLDGGLLAGNALRGDASRRSGDIERVEKHRPQLEAFAKLCDDLGSARISSRWPGCCPTRPLPRQLRASVRSSSSTERCARSSWNWTKRR